MTTMPTQTEPAMAMDQIREIAKTDLATAIVELVRRNDYVSFAEIHQTFSEIVNMSGEWFISAPRDPNMVIWAGMSEGFSIAMTALISEKRVFLHPSSLMVYMIDGMLLQYPQVKRNKQQYKTPHWLICELRVVPRDGDGP